MSTHVLLNLFNKLGKRDKMRGLPSISSLFRNEFNKFNNTRARMLDSIYHIILRWEHSGSVVECLTRDRRAAGSSLTGITALWPLSKTHLS